MSKAVFGITGWKNSGKTTLTEKLIAEFTNRGIQVASVKHAHHAFDIDKEGTDSFRHRKAGAREVAIVSGNRWALMHEIREDEDEPELETIIAQLSDCDLVLVEGYKRQTHPKIECRRKVNAARPALAGDHPAIVAIASDEAVDAGGLPFFDLNDIAIIADFIARHVGLEAGHARHAS